MPVRSGAGGGRRRTSLPRAPAQALNAQRRPARRARRGAPCARRRRRRQATLDGRATGLRSAPIDSFLGTAASAPTASRGTSAALLRRGGDRLLVDCGEGTQRQLLRSDTGLVDLEDIFLTHLHADHVLGLPGMLKTFALRGRELPVRVHGPRGTRALLGHSPW